MILDSKHIHPSQLLNKHINLKGVDPQQPDRKLRLANVHVESEYVTVEITAAVMNNSRYDMIIGNKYLTLVKPAKPVLVQGGQLQRHTRGVAVRNRGILRDLPPSIRNTTIRASHLINRNPGAHTQTHQPTLQTESRENPRA